MFGLELTILATSDLHGYILPTNFGSTGQDLPISLAKVASVMKEQTAKAKGPVVKIDNGDFIQGSPLSYYVAKSKDTEKLAVLMENLNQIDYDAAVFGNHEFNYGLDYLRKAGEFVHHPMLAANIVDQSGQPAFGPGFTIIEKSGVKIAILGVTTSYIPNWEHPDNIVGLSFENVIETVKRYLPFLRSQADVVIVSYHGGFEGDLLTGEPTESLTGENEGWQLLQEVKGIDALITGHQHREIATIIEGVPTIQPGFRGEFVGKITLELEKDGSDNYKVVDGHATLLPVDSHAVDEAVMANMSELAAEVESWLDQPLGKVDGSMIITDPNQARIEEHPYVELIQKVQMQAAGVTISGTALFNNEGKGFSDLITMRDVVTNYIYPNTLAVLTVTGADLKAALEQSAAFFELDATGEIGINPSFISPKPQFYNYDMYEGIEYIIDVSQPIGQRITHLTYQDQDIDLNETFEIVVNQYRGVGGGNYTMFDASKIIREVPVDMTELIANYLDENPLIEATVNHNFKVVK